MSESESERFERLLAKIDPKLRIARLQEELNGKEGQPGLAQRFIDQRTDVEVQQALAKRLMDHFNLMDVSDPSYERARIEAHQAAYTAVNWELVLLTIADELERVQTELDKFSG